MQRVWVVTGCAGMILLVVVGIRQSLGLFLSPVTADLGTGREVFALGLGLMNLFYGLGSPIAGGLADKFGAARVAAIACIAYAAGLYTMTLDWDGTQLLVGGSLIGIGLSATGLTVMMGTVGRNFPPETRSRALGVAAMCSSIGQFVVLPYSHALIANFGWEGAFLILAGTVLLVLPLSVGLAGGAVAAATQSQQTVREALVEARGVPSFWLLIAGFFVCGFHVTFVAVHLPTFFSDQGLAPWIGTAALMLVGFGNTVGSYLWGSLGARFQKRRLLTLLYLIRAALFFLFMMVPLTTATALIFSLSIGFVWLGTVPLTSGLVGHIFGTRYMSMLFGFVFMAHQLGSFLGAWLGGTVYDTFGSYDAMWWIAIALGIMSALVHWPIREEPLPRVAAEERG